MYVVCFPYPQSLYYYKIVFPKGKGMSTSTEPKKLDLGSKDQWFRGIFMIMFMVIGYVLYFVVLFMSIVQFVMNIVAKKPNDQLLKLGQSVSTYAYEIIRFLNFNSEKKPFPFSPWPSDTASS